MVIVHSYADVIEMKRANVRNYALIIRSLRASPAFKCECETSSALSSNIFFSPRRIKGGVNIIIVMLREKCLFKQKALIIDVNFL